jgi:hypothetical protein
MRCVCVRARAGLQLGLGGTAGRPSRPVHAILWCPTDGYIEDPRQLAACYEAHATKGGARVVHAGGGGLALDLGVRAVRLISDSGSEGAGSAPAPYAGMGMGGTGVAVSGVELGCGAVIGCRRVINAAGVHAYHVAKLASACMHACVRAGCRAADSAQWGAAMHACVAVGPHALGARCLAGGGGGAAVAVPALRFPIFPVRHASVITSPFSPAGGGAELHPILDPSHPVVRAVDSQVYLRPCPPSPSAPGARGILIGGLDEDEAGGACVLDPAVIVNHTMQAAPPPPPPPPSPTATITPPAVQGLGGDTHHHHPLLARASTLCPELAPALHQHVEQAQEATAAAAAVRGCYQYHPQPGATQLSLDITPDAQGCRKTSATTVAASWHLTAGVPVCACTRAVCARACTGGDQAAAGPGRARRATGAAAAAAPGATAAAAGWPHSQQQCAGA